MWVHRAMTCYSKRYAPIDLSTCHDMKRIFLHGSSRSSEGTSLYERRNLDKRYDTIDNGTLNSGSIAFAHQRDASKFQR